MPSRNQILASSVSLGEDVRSRPNALREAGRRPGRLVVLSSVTNWSIESSRPLDNLDICSAVAASCVELEVDCCTKSRIFSMARTTDCAPEACSSIVELISWVISVRRVVALAICVEPVVCSLVAAPICWIAERLGRLDYDRAL